jgi:multisubunit Na+/H+ antiporter MnhB subunit
MAQLFWRSRLKRRARKIILSLPDLPSDIDDNVFIALGTQAAEADKTSKAYDEFLFSEEGYEQMPYEDGVDEVLTLQEQRNAERKGRATLPIRMRIEYLEKLIEANKRSVIDAEAEKDAIAGDINKELEILAGTTKGEDGGVWEGVSPDTTSRSKHITERLKEWGIFVIVAVADAFVVFLSLRAITTNEEEALWLSGPAIGVQILFPHLVGRAIAEARSKRERSLKDWTVAVIVALAWAGYVFAMTVLRTDLIASFYFQRYQKPLEGTLEIAIFIFSVLILVGLGLWVLIRALNANPHRNRFSRLKYVYFNKQRSLRRAEARKAKAEADLEAELKVLDEVSEQWDKRAQSYSQVSEAAKSVYRRALVNQQGAPEFTTEYLPEAKFKIKKSRKQS